MSIEDDGSVSSWIGQIKQGDHVAAQRLWERYYARLVGLARAKLASRVRRSAEADEEDAVLSAFDSFCQGAGRGQYPRLRDRNDLWRLLVVITARKVSDQLQRHDRRKRGGGHVVKGSAGFGGGDSGDEGLDQVIGREPSPEFAATVADEMRTLLDALGDPTLRRVAVWRLEGYTSGEIAEKLGCAQRTVSYKLEYIRNLWAEKGSP